AAERARAPAPWPSPPEAPKRERSSRPPPRRGAPRRPAEPTASRQRLQEGAEGVANLRPWPDGYRRLQDELLSHAYSTARLADNRKDALGGNRGRRSKGHEGPSAVRLDALSMKPPRQGPQAYHVEERIYSRRGRPEAVGQLGPHLRDLFVPPQLGQALVDSQALIHLGNIAIGQERLHAHVDDGLDRRATRLAAQFSHGLCQELRVKIEAHRGNVAVLLRAQQIAGAADLQIPHGEPEPSPELGHLLDHLEPPLRCLVHTARGRHEQISVGL